MALCSGHGSFGDPQTEQKAYEGRNVKRIREILDIKQDDLALRLGLSQQAVSQLEAKEALDLELLDRVAGALGVSAEAIRSFSEEAVINYFNTFNDHSVNNGAVYALTAPSIRWKDGWKP